MAKEPCMVHLKNEWLLLSNLDQRPRPISTSFPLPFCVEYLSFRHSFTYLPKFDQV